jgi:transcriptional regulator with XRE-family HTH domain
MGGELRGLRLIVGENIKYCREKIYPGMGGSKECAGAFGVSQQQWSPWELGKRLPKERRLAEIAEFFGTTVDWMRSRHNFSDADVERAQRMEISLGGSDAEAFFCRLERALSHPDRREVIVSITIKPGKNARPRQRKSV